MVNYMYMTRVTGVLLPIAYGNQQDDDIPSIVDMLQDAIPTGYSIIWVRLPESSNDPKLSNLLFPMLCVENEDDGSFSPIYTEAFNVGMAFDEFNDDEAAYEVILTASKYSNKVKGNVYDFEEVYVGYTMSYDAHVIRNYKTQSFKALKASVDRLGKNIEETGDTSFQSVLNLGIKVINVMNKKLAEQKAAKAAAQEEEAKEIQQDTEQQVAVEEQAPAPTMQKSPGVVGFADTMSEEKVEQMESKVEETLKVFAKEEPEAEEDIEEEDTDMAKDEEQSVQKAVTTVSKEPTHSYVTEESGNATVIYDNSDSIDEQAAEVSSIEALKNYDIPRFIPHTVKYELPIGALINGDGSKLAGMSYDDFFTCMEDYANTPDEMLINIPSAVKVAREVLHILKLDNTSVTMRNLLYVFKPEDKSESGLKALYELLKYYTEGVSPNGLYNNLYYLLYIYNVELDLVGTSPVTKNYKLSSILANFACDYKGLTLEEHSSESEDSNTFADDTEEEIVAQMYKDDVDRGNSAIAEFITDVISGKVPFSTYFKDNDSKVQPIEKVCILATYGYFLNVHHEALARLNFKSLNMCIKPYKLLLECFAIKVDPTTLGLMLDEINRFESRLYDTTEDGLAYLSKTEAERKRAEVYASNQYNDTLQLLKDPSHAPYTSHNTKKSNYIKEFDQETKSEDLKVFKQVFFGITKPEGGIKRVFLGVIIEDENPKKAISSKFQFYPVFSSAYKDLVQFGLRVDGLIDNEKLMPVPSCTKEGRDGISRVIYRLPKLYSKDPSTMIIVMDDCTKPDLTSVICTIKDKFSRLSIALRSLALPNWAIADRELINDIYKDLVKK